MIQLTEGQRKGIEIACERFRQKKPYTVIAGYAGTGKTTLIQYIIKELKIPESQVVYIAYTGKAALVLKNKGCSNAMTAHKLLYRATLNKDGTYTFTPRPSIENFQMVVCDEVSMLPQEMVDLLLSHHVYTIFLGDIGQLPPIEGKQTILDSPHIVLDEIVRQALDNPIIKMATAIRNNRALLYGGDKKCRVIREDKVSDRLLHGADQILCGRNKTRGLINDKMRWQLYGARSTSIPLDGDKVICLHNEWDTMSSSNAEPLLNGQIGTLINPQIISTKDYETAVLATFAANDGSVYPDLLIDYDLLMHNESKVNRKPDKKRAKLYQFAFGYAITVHKSQGSEFPRVLVYDEWLGDYEYHKKWLYTACTRAVEQLIIVK